MNLRSMIPSFARTGNLREGEVSSLFDSFQRDMRHWLDDVFREYPWPGGGNGQGFIPAIDVREDEKKLEITADLPGVDDKDVHVTLENDRLIIRGERRSAHEEKREGQYHLTERSHGSFMRAIPLPYEVDPAKISARFDHGVLHISLEKPAEVLQKQVKIPITH